MRTGDVAGTGTAAHAEIFESVRGRLTAAGYRILGSWAEAEDAVQDAWLRFAATDLDTINEAAAWLTTVVARICLDQLRSARRTREAYVGPWLPEPTVSALREQAGMPADPADAVARDEEISLALLVVLEELTPEQRVAFVLHDVFAVPYARIAPILSTSQDAARQLATRARRAVARRGAPRRRADLAEQRRVMSAFLAAAESGDLDGLVSLLAPDAVMIGDGGGEGPASRRPIEGAIKTARFVLALFRRAGAEMAVEVEPVLVNGDVGVLVEARGFAGRPLPVPAGAPPMDRLRLVMAFGIDGGRIGRIYSQLNPAKLTRVPSLAELRASTGGGGPLG